MSDNDDAASLAGFDEADHQAAYVFAATKGADEAPTRPSKRRKISKHSKSTAEQASNTNAPRFRQLLNGLEDTECAQLRQTLYEQSWSDVEAGIQTILNEANEDTLLEVTRFVNQRLTEGSTKIPTGFIVTGPNIASQELLFKQLYTRLREETYGPVVVLRSGDASNLKAILKQIIRDATNQKPDDDDDEGFSFEQDGRKLLNYDLEILHSFVKSHGSKSVVIAFQDSEAFDTSVVADLITLFNSWMDRLPFVLLFGIATSVDLFHERLSRAASRCLTGSQFDVEQASSLLERVFQRAVASSKVPMKLSNSFTTILMERQSDHVQSVQSFIAALQYSYMRHFYDDALSILTIIPDDSRKLSELLQKEHFKAVRMLPSFRKLVEGLIEVGDLNRANELLKSDDTLREEVLNSLALRKTFIDTLLRAMHLLSIATPDSTGTIELYMKTFQGALSDSDLVQHVLESIKKMSPDDVLTFLQRLKLSIVYGAPELGLEGWAEIEPDLFDEINDQEEQISTLIAEAEESGNPIRSSYTIHSKGVRTTVIAQRVQLSYEKSALSKQDKEFTTLVDRLSQRLLDSFTLENPQDLFLNEVWLYSHAAPYRSAFTPRPRAAIEYALSAPYEYLDCECCERDEGLSSSQPATAILYQMYLETGSLINIFDLWSAFREMVTGGMNENMSERDALVLFYQALAELKLLGMVKHSKKKADHLAKIAWKGI